MPETNIVYAVMKQRRNTFEWFQAHNTILADGQMGVVSSGPYRGRFKFGDGVSGWNSLPWAVNLDGVDARLDALTVFLDAHAALTAAHGSTPAPQAGRIARYGAEGGLKSGKAPEEPDDVVRKLELDRAHQYIDQLRELY